MKKPIETNGQGDSALQDFLHNVSIANAHCTYGHPFCSDRQWGRCSDELLSRLDRDNDGEPLGYRDGQVISLPQGWSMSFVMNWDAENPWLQAFVHAPRNQGSASLTAARDLGETTGDYDTPIPAKVMEYIDREQFDEHA